MVRHIFPISIGIIIIVITMTMMIIIIIIIIIIIMAHKAAFHIVALRLRES